MLISVSLLLLQAADASPKPPPTLYEVHAARDIYVDCVELTSESWSSQNVSPSEIAEGAQATCRPLADIALDQFRKYMAADVGWEKAYEKADKSFAEYDEHVRGRGIAAVLRKRQGAPPKK